MFYARDSGLTGRGFHTLGVQSFSITLSPAREGDLPELIRARQEELESPDWWIQHQLNGVVFYSWVNSKYRPIADAIKTAGIKLVQVADTHGAISPLADWRAHIQSAWSHHWHDSQVKKILRTAIKLPYSHSVGIVRLDIPLVRMIDAGDFFLAATPGAAERFRRLAYRLGGESVAQKVNMVPIPVNFHFRFDANDEKFDEVISVGRWDHPQKRQQLLMGVIQRTLVQRDQTVFRIFGGITKELKRWHKNLPANQRSRVNLEGKVSNSEMAAAYRRARVMLVSAAYEGCHNASAEAICSGCSIVSASNPFLSALDWHASHNSGRTVVDDSPPNLANALCTELADWDNVQRDPHAISAYWTQIFHPDKVAEQILSLFSPE